jgi:hypothetical protein
MEKEIALNIWKAHAGPQQLENSLIAANKIDVELIKEEIKKLSEQLVHYQISNDKY